MDGKGSGWIFENKVQRVYKFKHIQETCIMWWHNIREK